MFLENTTQPCRLAVLELFGVAGNGCFGETAYLLSKDKASYYHVNQISRDKTRRLPLFSKVVDFSSSRYCL